MPQPYSHDFCGKVIEAIELDGRKKGEVSEIFKISRNTINRWLNRKEQTENFLPEPNRPPGNNHKITDWKKFTEFASVNGDMVAAYCNRQLIAPFMIE
jgi:transposase